jgi:hypothetical protein
MMNALKDAQAAKAEAKNAEEDLQWSIYLLGIN